MSNEEMRDWLMASLTIAAGVFLGLSSLLGLFVLIVYVFVIR